VKFSQACKPPQTKAKMNPYSTDFSSEAAIRAFASVNQDLSNFLSDGFARQQFLPSSSSTLITFY
jgi:hypothetical protein